MKPRLLHFLLALISFVASSSAAPAGADSLAACLPPAVDDASILAFSPPAIETRAPEPADSALRPYFSTESQRWWLNRIRERNLDLADTTVIYPKFIGFFVKVYNWADKFFNSYDPEYVVGTGKRWKARIVSDNWLDSYWMTLLNPARTDIGMASELYANIGAYLQYMAVSVGYSWDFGQLIGNQPERKHNKFEFGFNCARFNAEIYYYENTGGTFLRKFGKYKEGKIFKQEFPGLSLYNFGIDAYYFINNRRYSHGAAYNYSKYQKKSAGSLIVGVNYTNLKINFDFSQLPVNLMPFLSAPPVNYYFHYRSFAAMVGYGFNWVITPRLLFNITALPAIGLTHCYEDSQEGTKYMVGVNFAARASLTYNLGNFFFGLNGKMNGSLYKSSHYTLFSSVENFSGNIGFRF